MALDGVDQSFLADILQVFQYDGEWEQELRGDLSPPPGLSLDDEEWPLLQSLLFNSFGDFPGSLGTLSLHHPSDSHW